MASVELPAPTPAPERRPAWDARRRWVRFRLYRRLAIRDGTDEAGTIERITTGIRMAGEAPWMLLCSALLASIGLDVNSTAVIIGAMLISPLMNPILGIGLGVGIADRRLLQEAARELAIAALLALIISTLYFRLSPLGEPTAELIARTTPTLLDVGVACFGGVAGIVAGSRRKTSLAMPGVAIATALMPPICTAGFGLATGRPGFFFGALYLFVLNALFIALATFLVIRLLKFPLRSFDSPERRTHELRVIGGVAAVAILPSLWFLYTTVQKQRSTQRVESFVDRAIARRGHDVLRWDVKPEGDSSVLKVFIAGAPLDTAALDSILTDRADFGLSHVRVQPVQSDVSSADLSRMATEMQAGVLQMITAAQSTRDSLARDAQVRAARASLQHPARDSAQVAAVARDLRALYPEIRRVVWLRGVTIASSDSAAAAVPTTLQIDLAPRLTAAGTRDLLRRAQQFAASRLRPDSVRVERR